MPVGNSAFGAVNVKVIVFGSTTLMPGDLGRGAGLVLLDALDGVRRGHVVARLHGVRRVVAELDRPLDVVGGERLAVMPRDALAQVERPRQLVVGDAPRLGEVADQLAVDAGIRVELGRLLHRVEDLEGREPAVDLVEPVRVTARIHRGDPVDAVAARADPGADEGATGRATGARRGARGGAWRGARCGARRGARCGATERRSERHWARRLEPRSARRMAPSLRPCPRTPPRQWR